MDHSKWHMMCCWKPMLGKALWVLAAFALLMAWVASTRADGTFCLSERAANGACPRGIPVAHFFLDSLSLGVLALGLCSCGKMGACASGSCSEGGEDAES